MRNLEISIEKQSGFTQVVLKGDIISVDAFNLKEALIEIANGTYHMVLDLSDVGEVSLTGLNALLMAKVSLEKQNGQLGIIADPASKVYEYLHLTKMTEEFTIYSSTSKSLAA